MPLVARVVVLASEIVTKGYLVTCRWKGRSAEAWVLLGGPRGTRIVAYRLEISIQREFS